ncbi:hypothetical protein P154DRAFT_504205 [Amniculicola lignicola CBS 123094]|uniref:Integral membrane protein n=1 Tax=Amniculicola lignicola CBS 123094 TaxID=1392246 RepID=A0A6A5VYM6_9PLEO|nr:hypothetical protein P154DRAFT_504205 [Amniculicola lignicola CBS 123094]
MNEEFKNDPAFKPWGPFISPNFRNEPITVADIIIASIVFGCTIICVLVALYLGYGQTKGSRSPIRSIYVWLIWLELLASFLMGLECYLHLLKYIKPSFAFYMSILFWWCIQVQLLLQIIINRIRIIVPDRRRSRYIMIGTAVIVTLINISVFNIWIPSRLQTSHRYKIINDVWDRIEKVIYLFIDALLNWYFLKVVKANLINNGLQKYNKLLRFNQRIIVISLLMDVMIIGAMSIPNSFVYIQFHPLAYLVKLNIEMTMANLIKRIAISASKRNGNHSIVQEFNSTSNKSTTAHTSNHNRRSSLIELSSNILAGAKQHVKKNSRTISFPPTGNQIKKTEEIHIKSEPNGLYDEEMDKSQRLVICERQVGQGKSMDDVTEGGESVRSEDVQRREDSDDETVLVMQKGNSNRGWGRLPD